MIAGFLLDEHLPKWWRRAILRQYPDLTIWRVGDPEGPSLQSLDPVILEWREEHSFILLTNNRKSLPKHLAEHNAKGRHVPGIIVIEPDVDIGEVAAELALVSEAAFEEEFQDQYGSTGGSVHSLNNRGHAVPVWVW